MNNFTIGYDIATNDWIRYCVLCCIPFGRFIWNTVHKRQTNMFFWEWFPEIIFMLCSITHIVFRRQNVYKFSICTFFISCETNNVQMVLLCSPECNYSFSWWDFFRRNFVDFFEIFQNEILVEKVEKEF